ncbi:hypothetical protein LEMLEM_LOCUS4657 [Lemmus lemmus]
MQHKGSVSSSRMGAAKATATSSTLRRSARSTAEFPGMVRPGQGRRGRPGEGGGWRGQLQQPGPLSRPQLLPWKMGQSQEHDLVGPSWTREDDS